MYEVHLCVIRQIAMVRWVLGMGHCCCSYTALCHRVAHHESKSFHAHWHQWLLVSEHLLINPKSMPAVEGQTSVAHVCLHMQEHAVSANIAINTDWCGCSVHSSHGRDTWTWSPPVLAQTRHSSRVSIDSSPCCIRHGLDMDTGICGVGNWAGKFLSVLNL